MASPRTTLGAATRSVLGPIAAWPRESQQRARRNALLASTALAERRRERLEVEAFLDAHARRHERSTRRRRDVV
jgi:hypothetical protein